MPGSIAEVALEYRQRLLQDAATGRPGEARLPMRLVTAREMQSIDRLTIGGGHVPSLALMESAGTAAAHEAIAMVEGQRDAHIEVLCGKGNNGGDGLATARHLARAGLKPQVVLLGRSRELRGDVAANHRALVASGVDVEEVHDVAAWSRRALPIDRFGILLDALLGTGTQGGARGLVGAVIREVNERACRVVALDLPSGVNADSTRVDGDAVRAFRTYTLCRPKLPLVLGAAEILAGRWTVVPIGIPDASVASSGATLEWLDALAVNGIAAERAADAHKGSFGHLLIVAGSRGKSGAAVLAARGALRAGAGLVTVATARGAQPLVAAQQAEAMTEGLAENRRGELAGSAPNQIAELLRDRSALALGPGLGSGKETQNAARGAILACQKAAVVDADGLNALAASPKTLSALRRRQRPLVLTPHPGEAGRLLGEDAGVVEADRLSAVLRLVERTGATVVLKGRRTLIASPDGRVSVNSTGNPGMASAGSGDVLTGILGALLARGISPRDSARLGVYVHGDAGDRAAALRGGEGFSASEIADQVPRALAATRARAEVRPW